MLSFPSEKIFLRTARWVPLYFASLCLSDHANIKYFFIVIMTVYDIHPLISICIGGCGSLKSQSESE